MSELILHNYYRSSTSYRVRIALEMKALSYQYVPHHLRHGEHLEPAYLAVNPQGLVPALVLDDGTLLTQSLAIIEYLDETAPEPPLLPKDALGRARVRMLSQMIACDIHPVNNLRVLTSLRALRALGPCRVLPAHGPDLPDLAAVCGAYLAHREERLEQVRAALATLHVGAAAAEVAAVTDAVYGDVDGAVRFAAEHSVAAQLAYLSAHPAGQA